MRKIRIGNLKLKIKLDNDNIVNKNFNTLEEMEDCFKEVKKKLN